MRIVPMTLRVKRYTRSHIPGFPSIHVEGSSINTQTELQMWGKVEFVADGDIRWSLVRWSVHVSLIKC